MAHGWEIAVRARAELGEGPTWDPAAERLLWVDILSARVHSFDPATGRRVVLPTEQHVGAAKPRRGGGLVVNLRDGVGVYEADGAFRWLHREAVPGRRGNDAAVAPDGSLWAGSMRYDERPGGGSLIRVAPDGAVTTVLPEVTVSNGLGWSPDGGTLYYIDTPTRRIDACAVAEDGSIAERRVLVDTGRLSGFPDGMTVDADGCLWVAFWDGGAVRRFTPEGALDRTVELPATRTTACAFGGPGLTDLYVSTARIGIQPEAEPLAGSLLVLPGIGRGLPQPAFAG
ncbi:SMP-30/gluconolactonase/LRE family protein [Streptomyces sp. 3MP-14]|uniref:SMP-30/gluconolactonase/LRE family protein n=1 Tax=Streptomyces mimosae TaxID=2586635 RepID=A0A5N6AT57_9ACTN|nr:MULTISPECIES: SMP-30/gluconolactonase/LRE family protein [Streptomyces]KAB8170878.1 SMP-30/gluconolactonase/LRE family protein [Streptomyces mimosae]KAB8179771.1 SMP-30/gluconolactonase/LRE family protein [Streptomyces sp. 3MP-14]